MPTVTSLARFGNVVGATVQPCRARGIIYVVLQYPALPAAAHDIDINLDQQHYSKTPNADTFTFEIEEDEVYEVRIGPSATWTNDIRYDYMAQAEPRHHTVVTIPVYQKHAIAITNVDTPHFVPQADFARISYAITGNPATVTGLQLIVYRTLPNRLEVERVAVPGPYAANGTYDWNGSANLRFLNAPYEVELALTSNTVRDVRSNTVQVAILFDHLEILLDKAAIDLLPNGEEQQGLLVLYRDISNSGGRGRMVYASPLFAIDSAEQTSGASFVQYHTKWGSGIWIPLLVKLFFRGKNNAPAEQASAAIGMRVLWDFTLDDNATFGANLDDRNVHAEAKTFLTGVTGYQRTATQPEGRTAHRDLLGMRVGAGLRAGGVVHWQQGDATWPLTAAAQRPWSTFSDCAARPGYGAAGGVNFRTGCIAGDVHRVRAYLHHGTDLDDANQATLDNLAPAQRSNELVIENWRFIPVTADFRMDDSLPQHFPITDVSREYEKGAVLIARGNGYFDQDAMPAWQARYTTVVNGSAGNAFVANAMLNLCGDRATAFRSHGDYLSRLPAYSGSPIKFAKRVAAMLSASDIKDYADRCEQFSDATIRLVAGHMLTVTYPVAGNGLVFIRFKGPGAFAIETDLKDNSYVAGWAPSNVNGFSSRTKAAFFTFKTAVDVQNAVHEIGHQLFLAHAPGHFQQGAEAGGTEPDQHDQNDVCIMSYASVRNGLCGLCLIRLAGWDYTRVGRDMSVR